MKINFERINYSPFGKEIIAKAPFTLSGLTVVNILLAIGLSSCFVGEITVTNDLRTLFSAVFCTLLLGYGIYSQYRIISEKLLQFALLSEMSDEEHNKLVSDYQMYKDTHPATIAALTEYGIVLDEQICPWNIIKEIEFTPSRHVGRRRKYSPTQTITTTVKLTVFCGKRKHIIKQNMLKGNQDLSEPISDLIASIPEYTDREIKINNKYYHTIF